MFKRSKAEARRSLLLCLFVLGLVTAIIVVPFYYGSKAASGRTSGLVQKTVSQEEAFPNYDIRMQEEGAIQDILAAYREAAGRNASAVADVRDAFVQGENELRDRVPTLKVDYNMDLRIPEVIAPDATQGRAFLTAPARTADRKHADFLINFLKQNNSLVGASRGQIDGLHVFADYTNPDGNLSFVELEQFIHGVPVFRGGVRAGFTRLGELIRVINNLAPGLDYERVSTNFGDPVDAVRFAAPLANYRLKTTDALPNESASTDSKIRFGNGGDFDITAEKMYFPTEPGIAVPAWRVLIWKPTNAYYVIVDAHTGTMLWRKNISEDQTQSATYNVYANTTSLTSSLDSPQPITPGPLDPTLGIQGIFQNRTNVTLVGNEGPLSFNNLGWITDNTNGANGHTDGNAVEAGLDIDGFNGVDAPVAGTNRVFSFDYNPPPGNPAPGDAPTNAVLRNGTSTHLFYLNNRYHDALYLLGFNEQARNFQNNNFGRGGNEFDRVTAEAQDSSGTNNANFSTPADGGRGRMQMYIFTNTPVNRDGDLDGDVVLHEFTHGLSNRLIGNGTGLTTQRPRNMGEGWSDFVGSCLLSEPTDPINGIYTTGAYDTFNVFGIGSGNGYYGIRRLPYAPIRFTGGPQNRPFNPLTAGDVNTGCNVSDGAFPPQGGTGTCNQFHNGGEVWASMLFEIRAQLMTRLGQVAGNQKMLQLVVNGMKLSPIEPNFQQERDAILAAAQAISLAPEAALDVADAWTGFAMRGMGQGATDNGTTVVESFLAPGTVSVNPFSVSDSTGDNDGFPEPGEPLLLSVAVTNTTGATVDNVSVNISGGTSVNYGSIANGQTVTNNVPYTVPANAPCGSVHQVFVNVVNPTGTNSTPRTFRLGVPSVAPATFSNSAAITIPNGAPATTNGPATPYPAPIVVSGLSGNKIVKVRFNGLSHTSPNNMDILLVGPGGQKMEIVSDQGGANSISNVDLTLADAGVANLPATIVTGEFKPSADPGQDTFTAPAPPPTYLLPAPGGTATFASAYGSNGTAMNGTWNLFVVDDTATNVGSIAGGWTLIFESADYNCAFGGSPTPTATATSTPAGPTATATGTPPVTVALPVLSASPGATITVPITVSDTTGRSIISYDFNIDYNPAVLQPAGGLACTANACIDAAGTLSSTMSITPNATFNGHFIISAFQAQNLVGAGTLLNLRFTVVGTAGQTTPLTFIDYTDPNMQFHPAFQWNEGDPPAFIGQGSFTVSGGASGTPTFTATNTSTNTPTFTPTPGSQTPTFTPTFTPTRTNTNTPTNTPTSTPASATPTATGTPPVTVALPNLNATVGSLITVPITVSDTTGRNIISYDFNIDYNPAVLQPAGGLACTANACFDQAGTLSSTMSITPNATFDGHFIISAFQAQNLAGAGTLLNLRFNVVGAGVSPLNFVDYTDPNQLFHPAFQWNEGDPPDLTSNGSVTVVGGTPMSPTPTNTATFTPTPTATGTPPVGAIAVSLPTQNVSPGALITVPVTVGDLTGRSVISYDFNIDYDPAVLQPAGGSACTANACFDIAGTLSSSMSITPNVTFPGHFIISAFQAQFLAGAGTLINLKFNVVGASGTSSTLVFVDYTDPNQIFHPAFQFNEGDPPDTTSNGLINVSGATPTFTPTAALPSIQFSSSTYIEDESQVAGITITRTGNTSGTNSVSFTATNGTASGGTACTAGVDFIAVTGQNVTFNPGETTKTANVTLCADGLIEADQTVLLSLSGLNLGTPTTAVLTINDTATSFQNQTPIVIDQGGPASPYPANITVSNGPTIIGSMRVTLYDLSATVPESVAFLLVSPGNRQFILLAGAGGLNPGGPATLNFIDTAGQVVPDNGPLTTGDFEPTSWATVGPFPAPAPQGPYNFPGSTVGGSGTQTLGGNFNGTNSNGTWSLFVTDAGTFATAGTLGNVAGGWGLEFTASTAAQAYVSGRVLTAGGQGIRNARVVITGNSLVEPRIVTTGSFGYFTFEGLATGETYVVTVNSQRYTFSTPSRVISLVDNVADADFIADPQE
ncbi:MAG: M36 family metallopeptidase [Pyrinomonadaceae bacterium]